MRVDTWGTEKPSPITFFLIFFFKKKINNVSFNITSDDTFFLFIFYLKIKKWEMRDGFSSPTNCFPKCIFS
jgi:hypothetical protein